MIPPNAARLPVFQRHRARRLAVWNAAVWAVGNGLASTTLVIYLAGQLKAERFGLGISVILAAPHIAGLLRTAAPGMIVRLGGRKRFCVAMFLGGPAFLLALPWICEPGRLSSPGRSLAALVLLWCVYHLLQYLGTVGLWSWLAEVAPPRIRGRFLGQRNRWLVAGEAAAAIAAGLFVWGMHESYANVPGWIAYAVMATLGAAMMAAAVVPLARMPSPSAEHDATAAIASDRNRRTLRDELRSLLSPLTDARFLPLLLFGCWFSFFNGVTQSAQQYFPQRVLGVPLFVALALQAGMRLGQLGISPRLGAVADRFGNRPVLIGSQLLVAAGLLFFALAAPNQWQWLIGAWLLWIAYAGINVCLPNLLLRISPERSNTPHIAAFYAITGLCYAASTIVGGALVDGFKGWSQPLGDGRVLLFFPCLFVAGWATRSLGAALLLRVVEPTARPRGGKQTSQCGAGKMGKGKNGNG